MRQADLKPAGTLARKYGVKALIYGKPGGGKTPVINTAPRPVLMACEPGLLSMRDSLVPTWEAYTPGRIKEFFDWLTGSAEARNFDTVGIDSVSQMAEIVVEQMLDKYSHGLKAYGEMARQIMEWMNVLFYMEQKHTYLICKMGTVDFGQGSGLTVRPYFPGQDLNVRIPHLYDEILYLGKLRVPGVMNEVQAFQTSEAGGIFARDRSGRLSLFEPPNFGAIVSKAMA